MTPEESAMLSDIHGWLKDMVERPRAPIQGNNAPREPKAPIDSDLQRVFGYFYGPDGKRRMFPAGSKEENDWLAKQAAFGGVWPIPEDIQDKVDVIIEHYAAQDMTPEALCVVLSGREYIVFDGIPGLDFGTPQCATFGVKLLGLTNADGNIATIEKRRAK